MRALSLLSCSVGMQLLVSAAVLQCLHRMCMDMPAILYILYVSVCQHTSLFTRGCVGGGGGGAVCLVLNRSQPICARVCECVWECVCVWRCVLADHSRLQPVRKSGGSVGTNVVCPGLHWDDRASTLDWASRRLMSRTPSLGHYQRGCSVTV